MANVVPASSTVEELLDRYERGADELRAAVAGMTKDQVLARPVAGKWTTHELICHLADTEMLYADRIKRVLAEENPALPGMDPDLHVLKLSIAARDTQNELALIELVRKQMSHIMRTLQPAEFQRRGNHSEAGPMTLETLLRRVTGHIPHHISFIVAKRAAMAG